MSQFKFKLENVQRLRERERDTASEAYRQAMLAKNKLQDEIAAIRQQHDEQSHIQAKHMQQQIEPQRLMESRRYQMHLLSEIAAIESNVRLIETEIERRRLRLVECEQTLKSFEKLRERQLKQWQHDTQRREQIALDEWALAKYWQVNAPIKEDSQS